MSTDIDDMDASKAPLLDHLKELRTRLIYSVVALVITFFIMFAFAENIFNFLAAPLQDAWDANEVSRRFIYTNPVEWLFTQIKVSFFAALCVAFPIIAAQIWMFVAPGLYKNEKAAFYPFLIATPILFIMGGSFVYYVVMPVVLDFLLTFEPPAGGDGVRVEMEAKVSEFLSFVMLLIFAFGMCFELPVLLSLLARAGIVTADGLRKQRRYAVLIAFIAAALLTPPDPLSQIGLAVPVIILYEISIVCAQLIERQKRRRDAELGIVDEDEDDDEDDDDTSDESGSESSETARS